MANDVLFNKIDSLIRINYPQLTTLNLDEKIIISGPIDIVDQNNKHIDSFSVEIELPNTYPDGLPITREVGGRIPRIPDRHAYSDGGLCLVVPDEAWKRYPSGSTVVDYIEKLLKPYLISQAYYEQTGKWLFGERSHGLAGVIEYYYDELETNDLEIVINFLQLLGKKFIRGRWPCYCMSGEKLEKCHIIKLIKMRDVIPQRQAIITMQKIYESVKESKDKH